MVQLYFISPSLSSETCNETLRSRGRHVTDTPGRLETSSLSLKYKKIVRGHMKSDYGFH